MCNWKIPLKAKGKLYITVVRPEMTYGSEGWAIDGKEKIQYEIGRNQNAKVDAWCDQVGQNQELMYKRKFRCNVYSRENERKLIEMVWTC